ncbi:MAG: M67 family metallopeptidase [Actinomycetota bacterium]|nr:M67 family metallopeptidase [Actinomycetota bacterium]
MAAAVLDEIAAMAYAAYPLEGCGLLVGTRGTATNSTTTDVVERFVRCRNTAESARVYTVDPLDHLHAERAADDDGFEIIGVVHSHTHSEPYPSATDIAQAPDPSWHYVIVGLKRAAPEFRDYRIADGDVTELPITVV